MTSRKKIIILLVTLMLVSGVAGAFLGACWGKNQARKRSLPQSWNVAAMQTLQRKLKLTPEQAEKVQSVLDSGVGDLQVIRTETLARTNIVVERLSSQIEPSLTAEQIPIFRKLVQERAQGSLDLLNVAPRPEAKHPQ